MMNGPSEELRVSGLEGSKDASSPYENLHIYYVQGHVNGKFVAHDAEKINRICKKIKLKDLDEYTSMNPEELIENELGDTENFEPEEEKWFMAEDGLEFSASRFTHHVSRFTNHASCQNCQKTS